MVKIVYESKGGLLTGLFNLYIIGEMGPDFSPKMNVKSLTSQQIVRIHQLFRQAKFADPSGDVSFTDEMLAAWLFVSCVYHSLI